MEHLVGNYVYVSLKNEDETLSGLLINVEEHYVYVQMENNSHLYVIPKSNVKYYVTDNISGRSRIIKDDGQHLSFDDQEHVNTNEVKRDNQMRPKVLSVYINQDHIVDISVPYTFNIQEFSDNTMKVVLGNPDVQAILAGRRQKSLEYDAGKVYITTVSDEEESVEPPENSGGSGNTFTMGNKMGQNFMTGQQMVDMLNNSVKGKGQGK